MASEQIIIEFVGDTSKLDPAINVISKLNPELEKEIATYKKLQAETNKATEAIKKHGAEEQKQIKTLKDVEKAVNSLSSSFVEGFQQGVAETLAEAGVSVQDFEKALQGMQGATTQNESAQVSLKKQLRELAAQLALLETQGKRNTEEYEAIKVKAGELKDAIGDANEAIARSGSDTKGLDNLIELSSGVAGGFAIAQGAAGLFGDESAELQKTLLRVNSAMAILQGLQQIQAITSKEQFQSTAALIGIQRVQTLQTALQAGTESSYTVVRYAAIAAQKLLNAVMASSPLGLLIVLVGALAAAWAFFSSKADEAAEAIKKNNVALDEFQKRNDRLISSIASEGDKNVKQLESQYATQKKIREAQIENLELQKTQAEELKNQANSNASNAYKLYSTKKKLTEEESADYQKALDLKYSADSKYYDIEHKLRDLNFEAIKQQYEDDIKSYTAYQEAKVFQARKGSIAELEAQINAIKAKKEAELKLNVNTTAGERAKLEAETNRQILELQNQINIKLLENQKFLMEAKLAGIKEGSIAELEERKKIAAKSFEIEIIQLGLSEEKKRALRAQNTQEQLEFDRQITERRLQFDLMAIQARLLKVKEGGVDEYNLQVDQLRKQYQLDVNSKGITNEKKLLIDAQYLKQLETLTKEFNRRTQEESIQTKQSEVNTKLAELQKANTSDTNSEVLKLKKEAIDEQAQLDILSANNSINNEALKQAKIIEIIAKANSDKRALDEANLLALTAYQEEITSLEVDNEKKRLNILLLSNEASLKQRIEARKRLKTIEKEQIDNQDKNLDDLYASGLIKEEEYQKKKLEIKGRYLDLELQKEQEKEARKKELINAGFDVLKQISDAFFEIDTENRKASLDAALKNLDESKSKELDNKNLTEQQKADIEAKYKERERQIKRKDAEAEKQAKVQQAIMNGLLGITAVLAVPDFTFGIMSAIRIALVAATTAIQVAKIKSTPIPGFKTGTKKAPRGYAWVGEEGPELMYLAGGEKIYKYADSMKIAEAWRGGSVASADDILAMTTKINNTPSVPKELIANSSILFNNSVSIDYDKLGETMAKHLPEPTYVTNSIDKNGLETYVVKSSNKTTFRNSRYKF